MLAPAVYAGQLREQAAQQRRVKEEQRRREKVLEARELEVGGCGEGGGGGLLVGGCGEGGGGGPVSNAGVGGCA